MPEEFVWPQSEYGDQKVRGTWDDHFGKTTKDMTFPTWEK